MIKDALYLTAAAALLAAVAGCTAGAPVEVAPTALKTAPQAGSALNVEMPSELTPMTLGATLSQSTAAPGDTVAVTVGVRLLPGWHTYAIVPPDEPYVQTKFTLEPQAGVAADGDWISPPPQADASNPRLKIYESTAEPLVFMHALKVADTASGEIKLRVGVMFQTCDMSRCLPPEQKTFDLKLKVAARAK